MIVSFKDYLNESQDENNIDNNIDNDDWTKIIPKETKETKETRSFSTDDILKSKKYQHKLRQNKPENKSDKLQTIIKKKKHMLPYTHDVDQDEMSHIEKTNPALYAALTSWN